ncbi:predicted protein [Lichtheimia corymbifera JMRC:FSU:9682]|uniref:Uncharacterized protein n=1 Tax=Lichtheimia corymbifera JMRC:FSU:9682 TaxID=1263082 RepID=A0A068RFL5_9FUNG|nr:predicted protein [Lichtheimia corymbifera JMRC:FSU:9682]
MAEYGVAKGGPHSDTRKKQAQTLWRVHFPALHIHISRGDKERWMNWVHALNEGVSLFASAMRRVGMSNHHPLWNCLRPFMPADSTADWLQDDENSTSACLKWGAAMKLHLPHDHFFSTNQKRRIAIRWHSVDMTLYAYIPVNHKRIVTLSATHPLLIRWKDGDNNVDVALRFKDKVDAQRDSICQYRIIFEKNDIYLCKDVVSSNKKNRQ